jgi:predicted ABC-class ATPase
MGVPVGVTIIVGGGFHGKSTLLRALELGVYNHIPGDGRELVVTRSSAVKIRAEDGRRVEKVNISPFINNLPFGKDTIAFATDNASGSTSQAANIVEALEVGTEVLLMDEDTSATNFMIRDELMQKLVPKEKEPITPFVQQVRNLLQEDGVSTVLVTGGSGEYFAVADTVIFMDVYTPHLATQQAKELVRRQGEVVAQEAPPAFGPVWHRRPLPSGFDPYRGQRVKVDARGLQTIQFGRETIDLQYVEQLVDRSQTRAIADILLYTIERGYWNGQMTLRQGLEHVFADIARRGLEVISPFGEQNPGDYAMPRPQETAAAINRLRTLNVL